MRRFSFRLEKIMEYRDLRESWAKDAYLAARKARFDAEAERARIVARRELALHCHPKTLEDSISLEQFVSRLDIEVENANSILSILLQEEEQARCEWVEAKIAAEALHKLRERACEEWQIELNREEQKVLDDWTQSRRSA